MLIVRENTCVLIRQNYWDVDYVHIGAFFVSLWKDGVKWDVRATRHPYSNYTIAECSDLLEELEDIPSGG